MKCFGVGIGSVIFLLCLWFRVGGFGFDIGVLKMLICLFLVLLVVVLMYVLVVV